MRGDAEISIYIWLHIILEAPCQRKY